MAISAEANIAVLYCQMLPIHQLNLHIIPSERSHIYLLFYKMSKVRHYLHPYS